MRLKLWGALLSAGATLGCIRTYVYEYADGTRVETSSPNSAQLRVDVTDLRPTDATGGEVYIGAWSAQPWHPPRQWTQISIHGDDRSAQTMFSVAARDIHTSTTLPANGEIAFQIQRPAGAMRFVGNGAGSRAGGDVTLNLDAAYMKELAAIVGTELSSDQKFTLFHADLPLKYARAIKDAGYTADLDSLLALRNAGVSEDFAVGLRKAGYTFDLKQVIGLSRAGVSRSYAIGLREAGFNLTDGQIVKLSRHGVSTTYARDMRDAGHDNVDDIINLSRNGVSGSFVRSLSQSGYKLNAGELVNLSRNGVSADYAKRVRDAGYDASPDDLIKLSRNGVSSTFIASLHDPKKLNLPIDAVVDLSRRGVDAETVKKIRGL